MESELERENRLVLEIVQAALGLISQNVRGISVSLGSDRIILHVAVHEHSAQVNEDVDEMLFKFSAFQAGPVDIEPAIFVGATNADWPGSSARPVYLAKER